MALEAGRRPSEIAEIGCDVCAWYFDEALLMRERAAALRAQDERTAAEDSRAHSATVAGLLNA